MPTEITVKFTRAVQVLDHENEVIFLAKPGDIKSLPDHSAQHYIRRGHAEITDEKPAVKKAAKKKAAAKK